MSCNLNYYMINRVALSQLLNMLVFDGIDIKFITPRAHAQGGKVIGCVVVVVVVVSTKIVISRDIGV